VGENPEAADAAGVNVARTRYLALMIGGALMAIGGAFITLALLGSFTLDIIAGRGWVCVALVIFGRWRIGRGVIGAAGATGQQQERRDRQRCATPRGRHGAASGSPL